MTLVEFLLARIDEDERMARAEFGYRWGPDRVRAECEAKRLIVELMLDMPTQPHGDCKCRSCWTLRLLALPYADHPDYQEEWKP